MSWLLFRLPIAVAVLAMVAAPQARRLDDCFKLSFGRWDATGGEDTSFRPEVVRFDPTPDSAFGHQGKRILRTSFASPPRFASWKQLRGDSIEFGWSSGFAGINVRAVIRGDSLTGFGETWTDVVSDRPNSRAHVSGSRMTCPANLTLIR
jgi:hypothetical protein